MARKKNITGFLDENANKSIRINFRITPKEAVELGRLKYKTGKSTSELYRSAMNEYVNTRKMDE